MVLYNDGAYAYNRMVELNKIIDKEPTLNNISKMVADDDRNHLSHLELKNFADKQEFLYKHPLLKNYQLKNELERLRKSNPERFTKELISANDNINRYRSQIKNNKHRSDEELIKWQALIETYNNKLKIMHCLIAS